MNKQGDIANFLRKTSLNKEITFPRKVKSKSEYLLLTDKKADIAITILVLGVIALCMIALLNFSLTEKRQKSGKINSFYHLQKIYDLAESVKLSGSADNYADVISDKGNFIIEKEILNKNQEVSLKFKYVFSP